MWTELYIWIYPERNKKKKVAIFQVKSHDYLHIFSELTQNVRPHTFEELAHIHSESEKFKTFTISSSHTQSHWNWYLMLNFLKVY